MSTSLLPARLPDVRETTLFQRALAAGDVAVDIANDLPVVLIGPRAPTEYERHVKPAIDRVGALVLLLVLLPVFVIVAAAVRIRLGPGVIYRQTRIGQDGEPFTIHKFRTMGLDRRQGRGVSPTADLGEERRLHHKTPADPRHTGLGLFLRAASLDELPQLWDVLRGRMSLVGPRPELPQIVVKYARWEHRRHDVKPGMTGLWQVTERDDSGLMHLCVATDLVYIQSLSFWTDLRMMGLTVPAIFGTFVPTLAEASQPN